MFGGKGAREGVTSVVAVKGNRKATMSDTTGQIIDLTEEKIYDLDMKKKTYKVTTFAELRKQMEDAKREAEKNAREQRSEPSEPSKPAPKGSERKGSGSRLRRQEHRRVEVDQRLRHQAERSSRSRSAKKARRSTRPAAWQMITDLWLAPNAPSQQGPRRTSTCSYAQKLYGPMVIGASAQDMAMALAMYPQIKPALDKMNAEGGKIDGTAILTTMTMEAVPPGAANTTAAAPAPAEPAKKGLGGMLGGLKKMTRAAEQTEPSGKAATRHDPDDHRSRC